MARIKIESILESLDTDLRIALGRAVRKAIPDAEFNDSQLYRAFVREADRACSTWETVPDHYVEK